MIEITILSCLNIMILSVFFLTDFKLHLINTLFNQDFEDIEIAENFIFLKYDYRIFWTNFTLSGLLSCVICFNTWSSFLVSMIGLNALYFPLIWVFSIFGFMLIQKNI